MAQQEGPQFTAISQVLAARLPTDGIPEDGVADAFRSTLYAAKDRGILEPVSRLIAEQGEGDEVVAHLAEEIRRKA